MVMSRDESWNKITDYEKSFLENDSIQLLETDADVGKQELYDVAFQNLYLLEKKVESLELLLKRTLADADANTYERLKKILTCDLVLLSHYAQYYRDSARSNKYNAKLYHLTKIKIKDSVPMTRISSAAFKEFLWSLNGFRLSGVFSKLTTIELIELSKQSSLFDVMSSVYGIQIDPTAFNHVTKALNLCSVGFYSLTSTVQFLTMFKHLVGTSDVERSVGIWARFKHEVWKRHWRIVNDGVWGIINLLTNYPQLFKLTDVFASQLTAVFVVLDLFWLYRLYYTEAFLFQEQEKFYRHQIAGQSDISEWASLQLEDLLRLTEKNNFLFGIFATAAALYITGFCIALTSTSLPVVTAGFFLCTFAMALNLSYKNITAYRFAEPEEKNSKFFVMTGAVAAHTFVPIFLMTAYSINFPLALCCTALYIYCSIRLSEEQPNCNAADSVIPPSEEQPNCNAADSVIPPSEEQPNCNAADSLDVADTYMRFSLSEVQPICNAADSHDVADTDMSVSPAR